MEKQGEWKRRIKGEEGAVRMEDEALSVNSCRGEERTDAQEGKGNGGKEKENGRFAVRKGRRGKMERGFIAECRMKKRESREEGNGRGEMKKRKTEKGKRKEGKGVYC